MTRDKGVVGVNRTSTKRFPLNPKRGRPLAAKAHLAIENIKPWIEEGISRRSWYRKRAAKRKSRDADPD
jgi:hypothetical protein